MQSEMNNKWYFIHGLKSWTKNSIWGKFSPEISLSLHNDLETIPLYPYGYIVTIDNSKIIKSFDCDVSSELNCGKKVFGRQSIEKTFKDYGSDLNNLIRNTKFLSHNEIWIKSKDVEIIGIYVYKERVPGVKAFIKSARKGNIIAPLFS